MKDEFVIYPVSSPDSSYVMALLDAQHHYVQGSWLMRMDLGLKSQHSCFCLPGPATAGLDSIPSASPLDKMDVACWEAGIIFTTRWIS